MCKNPGPPAEGHTVQVPLWGRAVISCAKPPAPPRTITSAASGPPARFSVGNKDWFIQQPSNSVIRHRHPVFTDTVVPQSPFLGFGDSVLFGFGPSHFGLHAASMIAPET